MKFSDLMKKVQNASYKKEKENFVDPYLYDVIFNAVKPEIKTTPESNPIRLHT